MGSEDGGGRKRRSQRRRGQRRRSQRRANEPANPPGCLGANSVKSHTESPIASQRSDVLLCWPTSSAVMMRVIAEK